MTDTVTWQKCDALAFQRAEDELVGWTAERSLDFDLVDLRQLRHLIEPAAADNADLCCFHSVSVEWLSQAVDVRIFN